MSVPAISILNCYAKVAGVTVVANIEIVQYRIKYELGTYTGETGHHVPQKPLINPDNVCKVKISKAGYQGATISFVPYMEEEDEYNFFRWSPDEIHLFPSAGE